jgi:hypothetical protein
MPADMVVAGRRHGGVVGSESESFMRELGGVIVKTRAGGIGSVRRSGKRSEEKSLVDLT